LCAKNVEHQTLRSGWYLCLFAKVGGKVHGELLDLGVVVTLDLTEDVDVLLGDEVDGNTLTTVAATTTNTMEVVLLVGGQIVVDDDVDVVNVNTTGNQIGGDEDTAGAGAEGAHDLLTVTADHISVHEADGVVVGVEAISDPVDLAAGVGEDDGLGDGDGLVQIHQGVQLVVLLDGDVELLDTLEGQALLLDQDTGGGAHELLGQLKDIGGHGGREESNLDVLGEELEDLVNLLGETLGEHLIGLIEDQDTEGVSAEGTTLDDVRDTAGGTDGGHDTELELLQILLDTGSTNEGVAEGAAVGQVVTDLADDRVGLLGQLASGGQDEGLEVAVAEVDALEQGNGEGTGLTGTGLGLGDDVTTLDHGDDGALLDGGGLLETVGVDTTEEVGVQGHVVEAGVQADIRLVVNKGLVISGLWLGRHAVPLEGFLKA